MNDFFLPRDPKEIGEIFFTKPDEVTLECISIGAHPEPEFKWFIDDIEITDPNAKIMTYISKNESIPSCKEEKDQCVITKLKYKPDFKDRGKIIGCEVHHVFYLAEDKDGPEKIDTIRFFVSMGGKPVSNEEIQTFDELIDGK